jgi:hypothetical protein
VAVKLVMRLAILVTGLGGCSKIRPTKCLITVSPYAAAPRREAQITAKVSDFG